MMLLPVLSAVVLLASPTISLEYQGPLKGALKEIAQKGHINAVVAGELDEPVQVSLAAVSPEEALESVARAYGLDVTKQGKLWILRERHDGAEAPQATAPSSPTPAAAAEAPAPPEPPEPPQAAEAAEPGADVKVDAEAITEAAAEKIREKAEAARERAEALKDKAEALAEAKRDQAEAVRRVAEAHAQLERDRVSAGGSVVVQPNETVDSAVAYGGSVVVGENGVVEGDAVAFGGNVELKDNAIVEGDAVAFGGQVIKGVNAVVRGETVSMGKSGIGSGIGAAIGKGVARSERAKDRAKDHGGSRSKDDSERKSSGFALFLVFFVVLFGAGFLSMMYAPQRMRAIEAAIKAEPARNGLVGFVGMVALPPTMLLLLITIVGAPVSLFLGLVAGLAVMVGLAAMANTIGRALPTGPLRKTQALVLAVGVLLILLLWQIPVLGPLVDVSAGLVALGAIIRTRFGQPPKGTPVLESTPAGVPV